MKKLISLLGMTLLLAGSIFSISTKKSNVEEASAYSPYEPISGLFERIENPSEVTPGSQVIIVTHRGYVLEGIGGNPAYAHGDPSGVVRIADYDENVDDYWQDDLKFLYLNNKSVIVLNVEAGASEYQEKIPGCVSFKAAFNLNGKIYNHYFGENDEEQYGGRNDYDSIERFLSGIGLRKTKDGKSTWELTYDTENKRMLMRKVIYDDTTSFLTYDYNGARHRFCFGSADSPYINLYRPVNMDNVIRPNPSPSVEVDPIKTTYYKGESLDYTGMIVKWGINRGNNVVDEYLLKYSSGIDFLFSSPATVIENTYLEVRVFNKIPYIIEITIATTGSGLIYNRISSLSPDYRGTYLLADTYGGNALIVDASQEAGTYNNYTQRSLGDSLTADDESIDKSIIKIVRTEINGSYYYHAMNYLGQYLTIGDELDYPTGEYYLDYTSEATINNAVTLTANSFVINGYPLCHTSTSKHLICFNQDSNPIVLYKLSESTPSIVNQVSNFVTFFEDQTVVCENADEEHFIKVPDELWANIEVEFNKLSVDAQGIFASTTYVHNSEELGTKENVCDRYDYILAKYNKKDFMLRKLANTYESNFARSPMYLSIDESNSMILIITIGVTSLLTTSFLLILKKKKHR